MTIFRDSSLKTLTMHTFFYRIFLLFFSILVLSSCGKFQKKQIAGDWTIATYFKKKSITVNGIESEEVIDLNNGTYSYNHYSGSYNGQVLDAYWNMDKKGNWKRVISYRYEVEGQDEVRTVTEILEGNWDFLTKSDGYKNKERIVFNSLSKENTEESSAGYKHVTKETYSEGDNISYYTIISADKHSLELKIQRESETQSSDGGTSNSTQYLEQIVKLSK